jgi:RNA polymerase sigma-70 factor (ECF subfamily)
MSTNKPTSDTEILQAFAQDATRHKAFEWLLNTYQQKTYWHIRRMVINHDDADDVLQNTMIKVWENLNQFKGNAKLYTWIYRIATNEALNFLNKQKQHQFNMIEKCSQRQSLSIILRRQLKRYKKKRKSSKKKV